MRACGGVVVFRGNAGAASRRRAVLCAFFAFATVLTSAVWAQAPGRALFGLDRSAQRAPIEEGVVRAQPISIDLSVIAAIRTRLEADPSSPQELALALPFDNSTLKLELTRLERVGDAVAIHGSVAGAPWSSVVLVERNGIVVANIDAFKSNYQIRYRGPGFGHELREVDPGVFREKELEPREPKVPDSLDAPPSPGLKATQVDDGSLIDVMVAYTPAVRVAAGGTAAVQLLITAAVAEANAAYTNSGVIQRIRLVHTKEVAYVESGDAFQDLTRLSGKADGFMDDVHAARDLYAADLVSLWVEGGCGLASFMGTVGAYFEQFGFSVVSRNCATSNRSFAHELGHNMGLRHDVFVDPGVTPFAHAHGYIDPPNGFRTIMAYNDGCAAVNTFCNRVNYFSNPNVNFGGNTTGVAATANAKLALDNTRVTVANFRASVATVPPTITSANGVTFFVGTPSTFTVTATGTPAPTFQLTGGVLPNTLTFSNATGILTGTPTLPNIGVYPVQFTAANGTAPNAVQNFTLTIAAAPACTLDIDGNGNLDALTDGLMILRSLFGLSGNAVIAGAIAANPVPTRTTWLQVAPFLAPGAFDVDGNGNSDALTDGLMILRAMFGLTGAQVTNNALGTIPPATRTTWAAIRAYLNANCGSNFAP